MSPHWPTVSYNNCYNTLNFRKKYISSLLHQIHRTAICTRYVFINTRFLVLERSLSVGVVGNQVRLYEINVSSATNILATVSLTGTTYTPVTKRLVLDSTPSETLSAILRISKASPSAQSSRTGANPWSL
jgi:hypothetical protein